MATTIYLMPAIGTGTRSDPRRAKYWDDLGAAGLLISELDYGNEPIFLVGVQDITPALQSTIAADSTCISVPDLAQSVGAQVPAVQNVLEAMNIPAGWVGPGMSYGSVVRVVAIVFLLLQRFQSLSSARLFGGGVTLDTRFNQLPVAVRTQLQQMAQSFNFNTSGITGTTTLRTILKSLADQWSSVSIPLGAIIL